MACWPGRVTGLLAASMHSDATQRLRSMPGWPCSRPAERSNPFAVDLISCSPNQLKVRGPGSAPCAARDVVLLLPSRRMLLYCAESN